MKICVLGLWHLGCVTAACCAKHFRVTGLDFDSATIAKLKNGQAPLFEPGLDELLATGLAAGALAFTTDAAEACSEADLLWLCADTPVNDHDESDVRPVLDSLRRALPHVREGALVLVSSQLPVGTCGALESEFPAFHFACSPENLRLGEAIQVFEKADRYIVGLRTDSKRVLVQQLFAPFTASILFVRTESAEMVKHALNSFLAVSVTFINEIARLCEHVGADSKEVSAGLKSDIRIGQKAYLGPGAPYAGGTLARDVATLLDLGAAKGESLALIPAIKQSNDEHRRWAFHRLRARLGDLAGKTVAILGLTYKPHTDTLRRSLAMELGQDLAAAGCMVRAFDPAVKTLPKDAAFLALVPSVEEALKDADAAAVCTEWPEFRGQDWPKLTSLMKLRVFVDANRFLEKELASVSGVEFLSVGRG